VTACVTVTDVRAYVCPAGERTAVFVVVDTDAGIAGVGEASQSNQDGAVLANVRDLARRYVGHDAFELIERRGVLAGRPRAGRAMIVAVSALEQALWDVVGRATGRPVHQLLGGAARDELRCYVTLDRPAPPAEFAGLAADWAGRGCSAVKVVAFPEYPQPGWLDIGLARVEAVGTAVDVYVECNYAFDLGTARIVIHALVERGVALIESPLHTDDPAGLAELKAGAGCLIASGEARHGRRDYLELLHRRAVDVVQPDVKWTGGIAEAKKVAALAEAYELLAAPHNNSEMVGTAASAHLAITLPNAFALEIPSRAPAEFASADIVENGTISAARLRERPGLGVTFAEDAAAGIAIAQLT
jgi:L-alanine-DL-glutamate epimerase-like enolase superfamily enzyme